MSSLPSDAPAPRLCIIVKWPDFEGYGFNLHAEKSKPGQYIGKVDENSPAEKAGLLEDDRIIEVNGVNIANENHKQVVQRIKAVPDETRLLVVDPAADKFYKSRNIVVRGSQDNVITRSSVREEKAPPTPEHQTKAPPTSISNGHHEEIDNRSVSSAASSSAASETSTQPQHAAALAEADKDSTVEVVTSNETMEKEKMRSPSPPPAEDAENASEEILTPEEDAASLSGSDRFSENDVIAPVEKLLEPSEIDTPEIEEPQEGREQTLPEADSSQEEEVQQQTKVEEEEEEKEKKEDEIKVQATPEQESDLEAEYDNVEIDAGRAEVAASQATSDSRRLSASSGESHSSHGSDTARTDPLTQSPMSTSPTPPPSLESAPEPVRSSPQATLNNTAAAATTTTKTSTTNNTSPKSQPVSNKNTYNSSGLNLNMSAAEMRAMLARKKKADPRKDTVDLKTKYEIIQNM